MNSDFKVIESCSRCGPYVWHVSPEDCPFYQFAIRVPLRDEPWSAPPPIDPHTLDLFRQHQRLEQMILEHMLISALPWLWLPVDDTEAALARMEDEGGPPC